MQTKINCSAYFVPADGISLLFFSEAGTSERPRFLGSSQSEHPQLGATPMKSRFFVLASAAMLLVSQSVLAMAQTSNSSRNRAPGQQLQEKGSVKGDPGALGYAPGDLKNDKGSKSGQPGASGYAPGRSTTGSGSRTGGANTAPTR
jgi:hypothetical protein